MATRRGTTVNTATTTLALAGALLLVLSLPGARAHLEAGTGEAAPSSLDDLGPDAGTDAVEAPGSGSTSAAAAQGDGDARIGVVDNEFDPDELEVDAGPDGTATVVWEQTGDNPHTVTADDGSFDSHESCPPDFTDCMSNGDTYEQELAPGTYPYHCKIHGEPGGVDMAGVVVVSESGEVTTTSAPADDTDDTDGTDSTDGTDGTETASGDLGASDDAGSDGAVSGAESTAGSDEPLPTTGGPGILGAAGLLSLAAAALLGRHTRA